MKKSFLGMMAAAVMLACITHAFALGTVTIVTKETQAKLGLNFTLSAERASATAVLVRMEIPNEGKLENLKRVTMMIGAGNGSPEVAADLQITPGKDGSLVVSFQLSPELADRCSISLGPTILSRPTLSHHYAVELKGYVTDRK